MKGILSGEKSLDPGIDIGQRIERRKKPGVRDSTWGSGGNGDTTLWGGQGSQPAARVGVWWWVRMLVGCPEMERGALVESTLLCFMLCLWPDLYLGISF